MTANVIVRGPRPYLGGPHLRDRLSTVAALAAVGETMPLDVDALRIELARRNLNQTQLAQLMKLPPTTLSSWVRRTHPAPEDLTKRIEKALGLDSGTLASERVR